MQGSGSGSVENEVQRFEIDALTSFCFSPRPHLAASRYQQQLTARALLPTPSEIAVAFQEGWLKNMLWTILMVLLILWLLGLIGGIGGSLIHLLLVIALVVLIIQLITGRRAVV